MAFNGSGVFTPSTNFTTEAGSPPIEISKLDEQVDEIATGLSTAICRDGQSTVSQNIPFNSKKITGLGNATADADALNRVTADARFLNISFKEIAQNIQAGNYTCVAADSAKHIFHASDAGASDTYTIPANASVAYTIGTAITFVNRASSAVTIAITSDTLVLGGTTTTGSRTLGQNGVATALKVEETVWIIGGTGLS
jgi:hypothetical protein